MTDVGVRQIDMQVRRADDWFDLHVLSLRCAKPCLLLKFAKRLTMLRIDATGASRDFARRPKHRAWPARFRSSSLEGSCS